MNRRGFFSQVIGGVLTAGAAKRVAPAVLSGVDLAAGSDVTVMTRYGQCFAMFPIKVGDVIRAASGAPIGVAVTNGQPGDLVRVMLRSDVSTD